MRVQDDEVAARKRGVCTGDEGVYYKRRRGEDEEGRRADIVGEKIGGCARRGGKKKRGERWTREDE